MTKKEKPSENQGYCKVCGTVILKTTIAENGGKCRRCPAMSEKSEFILFLVFILVTLISIVFMVIKTPLLFWVLFSIHAILWLRLYVNIWEKTISKEPYTIFDILYLYFPLYHLLVLFITINGI